MEIDAGAAVSIISDRTRTNLPYLVKLPLQPTQVTLRTYTGETIPVLGELSVIVTSQGTNHTLPLLVVKEDGPSLVGRIWLTKIQLDWKSIFTVIGERQLDELLHQHNSVFKDKLGSVRDMKVKLFVEENFKTEVFQSLYPPTCTP